MHVYLLKFKIWEHITFDLLYKNRLIHFKFHFIKLL